jgi:ATP-dependent Lon protease
MRNKRGDIMYKSNILTEGLLPSIAIRGIAPFPHTDLRIEVGRVMSKNALLDAEANYDGHVLLLIQENPLFETPTTDNVLQYGVVAKIGIKIKLPNGNFKVKFDPIVRAELLEIEEISPFFISRFKTMPTVQDDIDQELALVRMLAKQVVDNSKTLLKNPKQALEAIQNGISSDKLADIIADSLKISENQKYKYIETASLNQRLTYLLEDIEKEKYMTQIENQINMTVKKNIDENQKEYYLREKMKAIQEELGDKVKKESDIEELKEKILAKKMPKNIEEKAMYELARYRSLPASSGESGVIRTYLDLLVELPWHEVSVDETDINKAEKALDSTHFG